MRCQYVFPLKIGDGLTMDVPCGKCPACLEHRQKEWFIRIIAEQANWKRAKFLTLTYDDQNIPENGSLDHSHVQLFMKRLRKNTNQRFCYFVAGEYGTQTLRPHYHMLLMYNDSITDEFFQDTWQKGLIHVGTVTDKSIRYTLNYIFKSAGEQLIGRYPPYQVMSKGIGLSAVNKKRILQDGFIQYKGVKYSVPRYYLKKLELTNAETNVLRSKISELDLPQDQDNSFDNTHYYNKHADQRARNITARKNLKPRR